MSQQLPYRCQLMQQAIDITMGARAVTHGDFMDSLEVEAQIKDIYRRNAEGRYSYGHDAAMDLAITKFVRIMMGGAHDDHYVDLCGYVTAARQFEVERGGATPDVETAAEPV